MFQRQSERADIRHVSRAREGQLASAAQRQRAAHARSREARLASLKSLAGGRPVHGPAIAARAGGLRYVSDTHAGIRRIRAGRGFKYVGPNGKLITDERQLARIRRLAIPPAYTDVWICVSPHGHIQATGRDARGRKQYRYHPLWRCHQDATKFDRMLEFGRVLPRVRRRIAQHLRKSGLPREKVLATVIKLLETTLVRVGNEEYARLNGSFGLTTLRDHHVDIKGPTLRFEFRGKSGIAHSVEVSDAHVARIVQHCQDIPGQELFQWVDEQGRRRRIGSNDVNEYLRETCGRDFSAKDFRTWFATVEALTLLRAKPAKTVREAKRHVNETVKAVAARLGNTPTICRKCYIHPVVIEAYMKGDLQRLPQSAPADMLRQLL
jgi:DNA topoisomerase-1